MKKIILLILVILMISNAALACGGVTFQGNSGKNYCLSKFTMNWYSAYAWCKEQGMNLIDLNTTCGSYKGVCSELTLSSEQQSKITSAGGTIDRVWTNTSLSSSIPFDVTLPSGEISSEWYYRTRRQYCYAVCQ